MYVAGFDGCRIGWVSFRVDLASRATMVEIIDLPALLRNRPEDLCAMAIDIPIGLFDRARECDRAARVLLGQPRGCSVFSPPCRAALQAKTYEQACAMNEERTGRRISVQAWGIAPKIGSVDEAISPATQKWVFEVHPEVSFAAMNDRTPLVHGKKTAAGREERLALLRRHFPEIDAHLVRRETGVAADDLLDAAAAAWTALRWHSGTVEQVCTPEVDERGLATTIWF